MEQTVLLALTVRVNGHWPGDDAACQAVVERLLPTDIELGDACVLSMSAVTAEVLEASAAGGDSF